MPPSNAREYTETHNLSADDLRKIIPTKKNANTEKEDLKRYKLEDKKHVFDATKVRTTAACVLCGATRCIFSKNAVGGSGEGVPSEEDLQSLEQDIDRNRFICGDKIKRRNNKFYNRRSVRCGDPIEANYYNPSTGTKGGRIITKDLCAICYVNADIVSPEEIIATRDLSGKTPLPICRGCYDEEVEPLPFSGARKNIQQAKKQKKKYKKRQSNEAVNSGHKKVPRTS